MKMSKITNEMLGNVDSMILDTIEEDICLVGLGDTNIYTNNENFVLVQIIKLMDWKFQFRVE